jgi:hypothetical protein
MLRRVVLRAEDRPDQSGGLSFDLPLDCSYFDTCEGVAPVSSLLTSTFCALTVGGRACVCVHTCAPGDCRLRARPRRVLTLGMLRRGHSAARI